MCLFRHLVNFIVISLIQSAGKYLEQKLNLASLINLHLIVVTSVNVT